MSFADVNLFGIVVAPLVPLLALAFAVWLVLRQVFLSSGLTRWLWHPALFDAAVFLIVLSAIVLAAGRMHG